MTLLKLSPFLILLPSLILAEGKEFGYLKSDEVFPALRSAILDIEKTSLFKEHPGARDYLLTISASAQLLQERASGQVLPLPWLVSLSDNYFAIESVRKAAMSGTAGHEETEKLRDVAEDLRIKSVVVSKAYKADSPQTPFPTVVVVAHTKQQTDGKEIDNYIVRFVLKALIDNPELYRRFGPLSSPSEDQLAPGNFFIWCESASGQRGPFATLDNVGQNSETKRDPVDLWAP